MMSNAGNQRTCSSHRAFSTVIFKVGRDDETESFEVSMDLISARSKTIAKSLSTSSASPIELLNVDPCVFALYIQLINTGCIPSGLAFSKETSESGILCKLFALGAHLKDSTTQNAALEALQAASENITTMDGSSFLSSTDVSKIYSVTTPEHLARELVVDMYLLKASKEVVSSLAELLPKDFLVDFYAKTAQVEAEGMMRVAVPPHMPGSGTEEGDERQWFFFG
ncbi:hypothetical protein C7974DRAFT_450916 [Boeremia exigua]|uniref:uncharacterized protein n=1 Tax=Boeremia exigua TaxID=749465 RepID=UPI001E8CBE13|nr:uncharacterized protein C7974DRAFT_450916 [Boeremia exigua]KAH6637815.1 hypothetical protein C7974DRAFT_450916 [Boeremia exigua]